MCSLLWSVFGAGAMAQGRVTGLGAVRTLVSGAGTTFPELSEGAAPKIPQCDFKPEKYKGLPYETILRIREENFSPFMTTYYKRPLLIHQGHMQWVWDMEGRRYLDFFGGIVTISLGHCHPRVTAAAVEQLGRLCHTTSIYLQSPIHEYIQQLTSTLPEPLKVVYLVNSGSEANDLATLLAQVHTRNHDFITLSGGYHGGSIAAMGLTAISSWKFSVSTKPGSHPTMCPDVYRGIWGGSRCRDSPVQTLRSCNCSPGRCEAKDKYIDQLHNTLQTAVPNQVAGFIAEPIQGVNGTVQYPKGFLKEASDIIRERGGLYISDEVQTGFGRLGSHYWGFQTHGVQPDIVTMAKGIGNGFPMGAVVTTPEIAASMIQASIYNTFGGTPLAAVIGSTVLKVIEEDGLMAKCETLGTYLMLELAKLRDQFEIVGDVRGKGLMVGVEMVNDKNSQKPLATKEMNEIWEDCREMGLLLGKGGMCGQTFRIKPPMCISQEDIDFAVAVFRQAVQNRTWRRLEAL
ncbi:alanine--glyoxylate aminotransferase 2, mitochondrial isoform X1 [Scyliorhinus torazame]|uniref:alanine--glyoxylate aminotransferase 2, mitochondrial isoform X1 n=1 Tax=Scyliorhinus torazame TaxID=75743 RepID=UPI003B59BB02